MPKNQNNRDVKTWLTNFTRSIAYSAKGMAASTLFPETSQQISSSVEMMKEAKDKFKESSVGVTIQTKRFDSTAAGRTTLKLLKGAIEDIKSGDFSIPKKDDMFEDFGVDMDFDVTETENEDGSTSYDIDVSNDAKLTATAIVDGSLLTTEAVTNMSKRMLKQNSKSTEALVRTIQSMATISTTAITKQLIESNERLEMINDNVATIVNFLKESQATVNEATMKHYSAMEEAMAMQLRIWGKEDKRKEKSYSQQLRENGFDAETFAKMVKKNFKNNSLVSSLQFVGSIGSTLMSFGDMGGGAIRPMDMALQFLLGMAVPKNTKAAIQNLDKQIPKQLNRQLSKLGDHKGESGWLGVLADLFGLDKASYSKMNLGAYNKNAVSWDGYSKKALEEVIPFYLSNIAASLDKNGTQYIYDYKSGTFKEKSAMIADYNDEIAGSIQMAFQPLMSRLDEMMKTSDGQYKSGWSSKSEKEARKDFGREIAAFLKSNGKMKEDELEKNLLKVLQGEKYKYRLSDLQIRELREEARDGATKFASQAGGSNFTDRFSKSSDYAGLRSLIGTGDLQYQIGDDGLMDIFGSYINEDMLNVRSKAYTKYEANQKKKEEREKRNRELVGKSAEKVRKNVSKSGIGKAIKKRFALSQGGRFDEKASAFVNNIVKVMDSAGSIDVGDAKNIVSTSGVKGLVGAVKDDMSKYESPNQSVHKTVVLRALYEAGLDPDCYHFKWETYADQEWLYRADLEVVDANNTKWDQFPRVILPNMFVKGRFDIAKAKENYYNSDMCEATDISTRKRLLKERQEQRRHEREAYENSIRNQPATFVENPSKKPEPEASPEVPKASDIPKSIGTADTSAKGASASAASSPRNRNAASKKTAQSSSSTGSSDDGGQRYNSSAKSSATSHAVVQGPVNPEKNVQNKKQNASDAVVNLVQETVAEGAAEVAQAMGDVGESVRTQGAALAENMLGDNKESKDAVEESMQKSGSKIAAADVTFGEKVKGKLKTALKLLVAGLIGKKLFSRKGVNVLAAAVSMAGPIGIALTGLGAAVLATKIDFRRMFLGEENTDKNGELKPKKKRASFLERIFMSFKSNVIDEIALGARGFVKEIGAYAKAQLAAPLKRLFSPLMEGLKSVGTDIKEGVKKKLGTLGSHIKGAFEKLASGSNVLSRLAIRTGFFTGRHGAKGVLKGIGKGVLRAMKSRVAKDYKKVYGENWKEEREKGIDLAVNAVATIYKNAGKNPTPEAIKASKDAYFETHLADGTTRSPENALNKANIEFLLEQKQNNDNYKKVRQDNRNLRARMNVYHKAMKKSKNDINSLSTDQLKGMLEGLQKKGIFKDMKDDEVLKRLINEGNHDDMVKYLQTTGMNPDAMAKIYDQRDQADEEARKRSEEEAEIRESDKKYKNKILYFLSFLANRVSHGRVPVMDPEDNPETVGATLEANEVDVESDSEQIAEANKATLAKEEEQRTDAAEKQAELIADEEAKKRKDAAEGAEDASVISQGAKGTRKGGYERDKKKNDIYSDDYDKETNSTDDDEGENKSIFADLGSLLGGLFGGDGDSKLGNLLGGGGGGGILGTIKRGLSGVFGLFKNPMMLAGLVIGADFLFNDGKNTKKAASAANAAINPFSEGSKQHSTKIEAGNGTSAEDAAAYVINEDGTVSIKNAGNNASSMWRNMLYRGMANTKGATIGEQVVSALNNTGAEFTTGIKYLGKGASKVSQTFGAVGDVVIHPIQAFKKGMSDGWKTLLDPTTTFKNPTKRAGLLGRAAGKIKNGMVNLGHKAGAMIETGIDNISPKVQQFASKIGSKFGKMTGKVADEAGDAVVDAALKQSDDLMSQAAKKATASPTVAKAASGTLRSIWNKIKGLLDDALKAFENSAGAKSFLSAVGLDKGIDTIVSGVKKKLHTIIDAVDDKILAKFKTKLTSVASKMGFEVAGDAVAFVPVVGQVLKGLEAVWNGVTGALEAANLFAVKEEDVDIYMRAISAALKVLVNLIPFAWLLPLVDEIIIAFSGGKFSLQRVLAEGFYDVTLGFLDMIGIDAAGDAKKKLDEAQAEFDKEYNEYNARTGNNLTKEEYNDMKNKSVGDKIGSWWKDDIHFWDSKKTRAAKNAKDAYYEYGANSEEFKKYAEEYEERSGKSIYDYLGVENPAETESVPEETSESVGEGPAGYGIISSIKNLFTRAKSEAQTEIEKVEHPISRVVTFGGTVSKGNLWSSLKQLGAKISKKMLETSPEWNTVAQLTQINSALDRISATIASQFKYTTKIDEAKLGITDSNSGEGFKNAGYGFNQADPRWANMTTGKFKNGQKATMKTAGCGFSALADVDRMFGGTSTPDQVARTAMSRGDVADGGAKGSLFEKGINGVHGTPVGDAKSMARSLKNGQPVIISGQAGYGPGVNVFPKTNKHLVVGKGMDADGNVIVENPMYGTQKVPFSQLASQTKGAWAMSKSAGYGDISEDRYKEMLYGKDYGKSSPGDKNGEDYVFYQQQDPQWASLPIGPGLTVGPVGCVNTAAAMATTLLNESKIDPGMMALNVFNPTSVESGFTGNTWSKLKEVYGVESREYGRNGNGDANTAIQKAIEAVKEGKPVSLHGNPGVNPSFSWNNKIVNTEVYGNQHDILAYGMDDEGNFLIADPSDSTGAAGSRGKVTAAHIAPGALINGLHWARIYSKNGRGVSKNANFSAVANMKGGDYSASGTNDQSLSESASGADSGDNGVLDIFSKIGEGLRKIASNAMAALFSGKEYESAISSDGSLEGTAGDSSSSGSSGSSGGTTSVGDTAAYGATSAEVANIVNNSQYTTFMPTNRTLGGPFSGSFNPKYAKRLNQDLGAFNAVTSDQLNDFIASKHKSNSVFNGQGNQIIEASRLTGLDPRYILAHAAIETGWGNPSNSHVKKNNYFGIGAYNNNESASKSFSGNGFVEGAQWIKDNFYAPGQRTLAEMLIGKEGHTYAAYDTENYGRTGPNYHWANSIASTIDSMGFGPGATVNGRFNPMGYGTESSDDVTEVLENRLDVVVDLLSQIADNTKKSAGQGFVDNSSSAGYGSTGNAKTQLNEVKKKQIGKDLTDRTREKESTPKGDLGRSNLMAIHKVVASGYRGVTK